MMIPEHLQMMTMADLQARCTTINTPQARYLLKATQPHKGCPECGLARYAARLRIYLAQVEKLEADNGNDSKIEG